MYSRRNRTGGCGNAIVVIVLVGIVVLIVTVVNSCQAAKVAAPFKGMLAQVQVMCAQCKLASMEPNPSKGYHIGKILIVNEDGTTNGSVMGRKSLAAYVASEPSEVVTVISIGERRSRLVGTYTSGSKGYQYTREICVLDFASGEALSRTTLRGSQPPSSKSGSGDAYGSDPIGDKLDEYIRGLQED